MKREPLSRIIHEHQFSSELGRIEPDPRYQTRVLEIAESACRDRVRHAGFGCGFARIFWRRKLLVWYDASDGGVTLLSIGADML